MERLFSSIPEFVKSIGPNDETDRALAFAAWRRCAGILLGKRTEPVDYEEHILTIAVEDETWRRHLEDLAPQMLVRLNQMVGQGAVRRVAFMVDPGVLAVRDPDAREPAVSAGTSAPPEVSAAAKAIADDSLREAFISAASACLASPDEPNL